MDASQSRKEPLDEDVPATVRQRCWGLAILLIPAIFGLVLCLPSVFAIRHFKGSFLSALGALGALLGVALIGAVFSLLVVMVSCKFFGGRTLFVLLLGYFFLPAYLCAETEWGFSGLTLFVGNILLMVAFPAATTVLTDQWISPYVPGTEDFERHSRDDPTVAVKRRIQWIVFVYFAACATAFAPRAPTQTVRSIP